MVVQFISDIILFYAEYMKIVDIDSVIVMETKIIMAMKIIIQ